MKPDKQCTKHKMPLIKRRAWDGRRWSWTRHCLLCEAEEQERNRAYVETLKKDGGD